MKGPPSHIDWKQNLCNIPYLPLFNPFPPHLSPPHLSLSSLAAFSIYISRSRLFVFLRISIPPSLNRHSSLIPLFSSHQDEGTVPCATLVLNAGESHY
jgi:hypothetical protein